MRRDKIVKHGDIFCNISFQRVHFNGVYIDSIKINFVIELKYICGVGCMEEGGGVCVCVCL